MTSDLAAGRLALQRRDADVLVIAPADFAQRSSRGQQSVLTVEFDNINPYQAFIARTAADALVAAVNQRILEEAARQLADRAAAAGQPLPSGLNPEVIAAPTRADVVNLAPSQPSIVAFYGIIGRRADRPAHRDHGQRHLDPPRSAARNVELLRIAPLGSADILARQVRGDPPPRDLVALAVLAVLVVGFGVPFLASPAVVVGCLALLVVASTGSERSSLSPPTPTGRPSSSALLMLLASVFFKAWPSTCPSSTGLCGRRPSCCRSPRPTSCSRTSCCAARPPIRGGSRCSR